MIGKGGGTAIVRLRLRCPCLSSEPARRLLESLYGGQFTLSTPLIKPNFCILLPHRRSTTVSLETSPFFLEGLPHLCHFKMLGIVAKRFNNANSHLTTAFCFSLPSSLLKLRNDYQKASLKFGNHFIVIHIEIICAEIAASHFNDHLQRLGDLWLE